MTSLAGSFSFLRRFGFLFSGGCHTIKQMMNFSDEKLVERYLGGDLESFNFLIERYLKRVYNFIARYVGNAKEAEDLTQEAFLKIWRNLKKFDQKKSFRVWLWRIVRNTGVDYLRRKKAIVFSALESDEEEERFSDKIVDAESSIIEKLNKEDLTKEVEKYLGKLSEQGKAVILLHYNQQMTFQEIADLLKEGVDTVKSRHRRSLIYLKKMMERESKSLPTPLF